MGTPAMLMKLVIGDTIKDIIRVKKKLGKGACGQAFLIDILDKNTKQAKLEAAMKVEPIMKHKDDEILKMEICILKRLGLLTKLVQINF